MAHEEIHDDGVSPPTFTSFDRHVSLPLSEKTLPVEQPQTTALESSSLAPIVFLFYASLTIYSWLTFCVLNFRPFEVHYWSYDRNEHDKLFGYWPEGYERSQRMYRAAVIINSLVAVLGIPLTSTICARAAAKYAQRQRKSFTIRQSMALANRDWANLLRWRALVYGNNRRSYGNRFLWSAVILHVLATTIVPIQTALLRHKEIRRPGDIQKRDYLTDFSELFDPESSTRLGEDSGRVVLQLRRLATGIQLTDYHPNIWYNDRSLSTHEVYGTPHKRNTLDKLVKGSWQPFVSQLEINATKEEEFPSNCENLPGAFYAEYSGSWGPPVQGYRVQACMPKDQTISPWRYTRLRQDIKELLYLRVNITEWQWGNKSAVFKIQLNTTAGYFELPNYLNNNTASEILSEDPNTYCDRHCMEQREKHPYSLINSTRLNNTNHDRLEPRATEPTLAPLSFRSTLGPEMTVNKGPLLAIAIAMFGNGSYMETHSKNPSVYELPQLQELDAQSEEYRYRLQCREFAPFAGLFSNDATGCITNNRGEPTSIEIYEWLSGLWSGQHINTGHTEKRMVLAFSAAAFLANYAWLTESSSNKFNQHLTVNYDLGVVTTIPIISLAGIVTVSALLVVFLLGLGWMAFYVRSSPVWTTTLDAFAMMRIGASIREDVHLVAGNEEHLFALDTTPGWVGEEEPESTIGRSGLGGEGELKRYRKYFSY
ncbi:hypothetical protein EJ08DRAFT_739364 [Tothia fuscella]|uniref:Uncharacterized protein n=1 Tax=Tothia fuscella TaxID=1048955 RepID=A0A9P4NEW0_9PEZI|nr:hypothetical protein EJ08DRAFT_739364 [Tothia fuscella]